MKNHIFKKDINKFFYSRKFLVFALFVFMIISILFAAKKTVEQQQQQYKDVTANFCEEGCTYRFPKAVFVKEVVRYFQAANRKLFDF